MRLAEPDAAVHHLGGSRHDEQRIAVFLKLGLLVSAFGVLDREGVQIELPLHANQQIVFRLVQADPDHVARAARPFPGVVDSDIDELTAGQING